MSESQQALNLGPVVEVLRNPNPVVRKFGPRPEGGTCKGCVHLLFLQHHDYGYYKCDLRQITHGAASDHRVGWDACVKYARREEYDI